MEVIKCVPDEKLYSVWSKPEYVPENFLGLYRKVSDWNISVMQEHLKGTTLLVIEGEEYFPEEDFKTLLDKKHQD